MEELDEILSKIDWELIGATELLQSQYDEWVQFAEKGAINDSIAKASATSAKPTNISKGSLQLEEQQKRTAEDRSARLKDSSIVPMFPSLALICMAKLRYGTSRRF